MAPVHKKVLPNMTHNESNNHIINRFINNHNNNTQTYNNHYSLSLNRHEENHNSKLGVGSISTLTSPYAGNGIENVFRGTKSDIGIPLGEPSSKRLTQSALKNSILHKSTSPSMKDIINNNNSPTNSGITFSKTGSKLLYTNKHRLMTPHSKVTYDNAQPRLLLNDMNANKLGPLIFKNDSESGSWKHFIYDNPIRSVRLKESFRL